MTDKFKYKVVSTSPDRNTHEKKKEWLVTQEVFYGDYKLIAMGVEPSWPGLNFYFCFDNPEIATLFKLKWGQSK